ncbi:MAG: threonylcarbamoyl-AMP synthase [Candidatus Thermofonsia Clade 1 bacterium]|uniref:Threonylcarbamoyl-AMP synthase n=1 Tax=Candidatus Thermofonsia Clade 1 bacterium TaxID=2364210 RepID=A0A2M8PDY4_9CHLR|nr:MAG: threonylcarbamoyl-AMP synthase [Candidatus Thermofonsia Clade 1 bacterium]
MPAEIIRISPERPEPTIIAQAAALIRAGQLVAFPTETVYGLGANAFDENAVAGIFKAKGRPAADPIIVHCAEELPADVVDWSQLSEAAQRSAQALQAAFMPGALTLVLPRGGRIPPIVTAGLPSVGVRMPSHPVAQALIRASGVPIAAPSANRFAHTSPTTAQHVYADLADQIALILDGGAAQVGVESSILDLCGERPRLLRHGGVPLEALQACLARSGLPAHIEVVTRYVAEPSDALPASGMLLKHYAPRAALTLYESADDTRLRAALGAQARRLAAVERVGLLIAAEDAPFLADLPNTCTEVVGSLSDLAGVAHNLFAALRRLDDHGVTVILARSFPAAGIGAAVRDRLIRAASGRLVHL